MKKKLFLCSAVFATLTLLLFTNCTTNVANGGTEVGSPRISAMLYNPGGSPAVHAKVKFFQINYNPRSGGLAIDSTTTDVHGNYNAKLDTGTYNILVSGDSGVAYQDSITVIKDSTVHPPADTLKTPGSIHGMIRLQPGDDARTVFIIFMGTNVLNMPEDAIGNFAVANMAEGTYRVRILTTLDAYLPKDTILSFRSGEVDSLPHDILLQYTGIPLPSGLTINYDTLKQIVNLSWNKPTTGKKIVGYNIYRQYMGSTDSSLVKIKGILTDTVFRDSTAIQDQTYEYRVAVVDTNASEGVKSAEQTVTITGLYSFALSFGLEGSTGGFTNQHGICFGQDSVILVADYQNSKIKRFTAQGHFLNQFGTAGTGDGQFDRVWDVAMDDSGYVYTTEYGQHRIQKFDAPGNLIKSWQIPTTRGGNSAHLTVYDTSIYVTYVYSSEIDRYSTNGDSLGSVLLPTVINGFGYGGWDITADKHGDIYVAVLNEVYILDNDGNLIKSFPIVPGSSTGPDPRCIVIDTTGNISVACLTDMLIRVYDQNGNYLAKWGAAGSGVGQFTSFSSMVIAPDNSTFVSDGDLGRIQKFTRNK